jgi:chromosome segregation ATPase
MLNSDNLIFCPQCKCVLPELTWQLRRLEEDVKYLLAERAEYEVQLANYMRENQSLHEKITELEAELAKEKEDSSIDYMDEYDLEYYDQHYEDKILEYEEMIEQYEEEIESLLDPYEDELADYLDGEVIREYHTKEIENHMLFYVIAEYEEEIAEYRAELEMYYESEMYQDELDEQELEIEAYEDRIAVYEKELDDYKEEVERLRDALKKYQLEEIQYMQHCVLHPGPFVASRIGDHFHRPSCKWAQQIAPSNFIEFSFHEEAVRAGYRPCKTCRA